MRQVVVGAFVGKGEGWVILMILQAVGLQTKSTKQCSPMDNEG